MKRFLYVIVIAPSALGVFSASVYHFLQQWEHARWFCAALYLVLSIGVWFPFVFAPYVRDRERP